MKDRFLIRRQYAYIIPAALYILWQACAGWLNTWWTLEKLGESYTTINFVLFFFAHAAGTAFFAFLLDKPVPVKKLRQLALFSTLSTGLLTALMAFAGGLWLISAVILSGFCAGFFTAYLSFYLFVNIPPENRGVTLGISAGAGLAVHYILFTLCFPQTTAFMLYAKTFFAAGIFLLLGILSLGLPICREELWSKDTAFYSEPKENHVSRSRMQPMLLLLLILMFFSISYSIQDFAATAYWMNGSSFLGHTRIFLIAGYIAGGLLWDFKNRSILFSSSFALLAMGFIAMACQYKGAASFIGFAGVQLASVFFSISIRLVFLDIARFYKRPILVGSLGLVLPLILKQSGILSASVIYAVLGGTALFVTSLVFIALGFPFISLLFETVRDMNILDISKNTPVTVPPEDPTEDSEPAEAVGQREGLEPSTEKLEERSDISVHNTSDFSYDEAVLTFLVEKYSFTKRETQILELALHGMSKPQMAQHMNIREATVKQHIRNILSKTGMKSLNRLIIAAINGNKPPKSEKAQTAYM